MVNANDTHSPGNYHSRMTRRVSHETNAGSSVEGEDIRWRGLQVLDLH
jgi:hypothetical protein